MEKDNLKIDKYSSVQLYLNINLIWLNVLDKNILKQLYNFSLKFIKINKIKMIIVHN